MRRSSFEEAFAKDFSLIKPEEVGVTSKAIPSSKECPSCKELNLKITELEDALTKTAISKANETQNLSDSTIEKDDDNSVNFEFFLPLEDVYRYVEDCLGSSNINDKIWLSGKLDKRTGQIIQAYIGKMPQQRTISENSKEDRLEHHA